MAIAGSAPGPGGRAARALAAMIGRGLACRGRLGHRAHRAARAGDRAAAFLVAASSGEGEEMTGDQRNRPSARTDEPGPPGRRQTDRHPPNAASTPAAVPGEPLDTSFAEPAQTPAARAAGVAPHPEQDEPDEPAEEAEFRRLDGAAAGIARLATGLPALARLGAAFRALRPAQP